MPDKISDAAFNLIVAEEDSDKAYYDKHYRHWDWPLGASGPTIGIGYDCGYVTTIQAKKDWQGLVDGVTLNMIALACGHKGEDAHRWVQAHKNSVTIEWNVSLQQFRERELPKWIKIVINALSNTYMLSEDSFGALVSLTYNRGASFNSPGARYAEMRSIRSHMALKQFDKIPDDFLSMRRLWPQGGDLWRRRGHEADLFRKGLTSVSF